MTGRERMARHGRGTAREHMVRQGRGTGRERGPERSFERIDRRTQERTA